MGNAALRLKSTPAPGRQVNEKARLKVLQGPDYGHVFVMGGDRVTIGRGEESDIQLLDLKCSRIHAEISLHAGKWAIRDLGSANGIQHNGKQVRSAWLSSQDVIGLGETAIEFVTAIESTRILQEAPRSLEQVRKERSVFEEQKQRVRSLALGKGVPSRGVFGAGTSDKMTGGLSKTTIILLVAGVGFLLWPDPKKPSRNVKPKEKTQASVPRQYSSASIPLTPDTKRTSEMFLRQGLREFREHNYLRAKQQFENVLQVAPGHDSARSYLERCNQELADSVTSHLSRGKQSMAIGRYKMARSHFEAVLRILFRDTDNPQYLEAKQQLDTIDKLMKGEEG